MVRKACGVLELKAIRVSGKQVNVQVFRNVALDCEGGGKYSLSKCREMLTHRHSVTPKNQRRFQDLITHLLTYRTVTCEMYTDD